ncbi:WD40 repeat domain-containing protein [Endozoicomonas numazuensis]|uniref:Anaphase-promoting complex subunit 4 WD40 domain-containing protein n=1 Tax=Endozoicomonas numazuensis TaxID=1137799 RepID=A0A081NCL2_9GAMM|nr:WD40 repeat domain-containing protein [Endozoicomonas numazuensis]KEQ16185.1 hypothetical protein GZ78_23400 [Endozoicomonas numazuensis]
MITKLAGLMGLMLSVLASISHGATEGSGNPEKVGFIPGPVIRLNSTELMEIDEENRTYLSPIKVLTLHFKPDGSELILVGVSKPTNSVDPQVFVQRFNSSALSLTQKSINSLGHDNIFQGAILDVSTSSGGGFIAYTIGGLIFSYKASPVRYTYLYDKATEETSLFATTFILEDAWLAYGHAGLLSLINPENKNDVLPLPGEFPEAVNTLGSQGAWLASGDRSGEIRVHNLTNLSDISYVEMKAHNDEVLSLSFSPDGERLLSGGRDNLARLWLREAEGHFTLIQNMTFDADVDVVLYHPGGEHYVVAEGPRVHLYEAANQTRLDTLTMANNMSEVYSLAFHPNGTWLAVGNDQNDIEFYSLGRLPEISLTEQATATMGDDRLTSPSPSLTFLTVPASSFMEASATMRPEFTFTEQSTLQPTLTVTMVVVSSSAAIDDNQPTSPSPAVTSPSPSLTFLTVPASSFMEASATMMPPVITTDEDQETGSNLGAILGVVLPSGVIIATLTTAVIVIYLKLIKPKRVVEKA